MYSQIIAGDCFNQKAIFKPFWNANATSENESADFANLTLKLVAMATSLEQSEKRLGR